MDKPIEVSEPPKGAEMFGPIAGHDHFIVLYNGYRLPYLEAWPNDPQNLTWSILVDERFVYTIAQEALDQVIPLLGDAMAVAAGYKSLSNACDHQQDRYNPFGTRILNIVDMPSEEEQHERTSDTPV